MSASPDDEKPRDQWGPPRAAVEELDGVDLALDLPPSDTGTRPLPFTRMRSWPKRDPKLEDAPAPEGRRGAG